MITIGYSTRKSNSQFSEYLSISSGLKNVKVIEKVNNGEKSLSQVYNEILNESETDIVILCHDDIYFDTKKWGEKLLKHFEKTDFGILGVAGSTYLPKSGQWWEDPSKMIGIVNHESEGKKWESKYSEDLKDQIKKTVLVDGLFIALDKKKIVRNFDESVKGFHMYDVNFCFNNFLERVKLGVIFNIRITHKSIGQTNEQWEINRKIFSEKYQEILPARVIIDKEDFLKILFFVKDAEFFSLSVQDNFYKNKEIIFISDYLSKETKRKLNKQNIKTYKSNEIPGFRIGDGRSFVKTEQGVIKSEVGAFYKINEVKYDFVICDDKKYFDIIKILHSQTPKIYIKNDDNFPLHDSIEFYLTDSEKKKLSEKIIEALNKIKPFSQKIKIVSGYSDKGGSTTAFIELTNYFNKKGFDCTFYGPHKWHLDKCKSDLLQNLRLDKTDKVITHYLQLKDRLPVDTVVLSSHELSWFPVGKIPQHWDKAVFLHMNHREFHNDYFGEYVIIPNLRDETLSPNTKKSEVSKFCGVIGTIETRKQTHRSIERALNDGCEKVFLFGKIGEQTYFDNFVKPYLLDSRVELLGFTENKQEMYDSIGKVYHSSLGEVACLVKDECYFTGTEFYGNEQTEHEVSNLSNDEIFNLWKKVLKL